MKNLTPQEVLLAIADGEKLEYKEYGRETWHTFVHDSTPMFVHNIIRGCYIFRLAEKTITIGNVSFPKPESKPLPHGTDYWLTEPAYMLCSRAAPNVWQNSEYDLSYLRKGLVHLTPQKARLHGEALIKLSGGSVND